MGGTNGGSGGAGADSPQNCQGDHQVLPSKRPITRCAEEVGQGIEHVAGAARLSIAAVEDMLAGRITPQEATVMNTTSGRILKACELYLKHGRSGGNLLCIPERQPSKE